MCAPDCAGFLLTGVLLAAVALPSRATLGEDIASIHADQVRAAAAHRQQQTLTVQIHTLTLPDGSTIRQYAVPGGLVFAVGWNTRFKPRLDQLLGRHFAGYAEAGRLAQRQRAGVMHRVRLQHGDLVVDSMAHLNAHVGRAYLRSLLPAGTSADALR